MPIKNLLLLTSKPISDQHLTQRIAQLKWATPDEMTVITHHLQGFESSVITESLRAINSGHYHGVILDNALDVHPWEIISHYRNQQQMTNASLKFAIIGDISTITRDFFKDRQLMGNVLVVKGDEPLLNLCYGNVCGQDNSKARSINTDTQHNISALTHLLTALTILKLSEENPEILSTPISNYLPPNFPQKNEYTQVTIHDLLTHTSGMRDYTKAHEAVTDALSCIYQLSINNPLILDEPFTNYLADTCFLKNKLGSLTTRDLLTRKTSISNYMWRYFLMLEEPSQPHPPFNDLQDVIPFIEPTSFEGQSPTQRSPFYSNLGFMVLGEVIEQVYNAAQPKGTAYLSFWNAIQHYILKPAGVSMSRDIPDRGPKKTAATNLSFPHTLHIPSNASGGNIWATVGDLAKVARWIMDQHHQNHHFRSLLQSIQFDINNMQSGLPIQQNKPTDDEVVYCQSGAAPGISSSLYIYPEDHVAIVVLLNKSSKGEHTAPGDSTIADEFARLLAENVLKTEYLTPK